MGTVQTGVNGTESGSKSRKMERRRQSIAAFSTVPEPIIGSSTTVSLGSLLSSFSAISDAIRAGKGWICRREFMLSDPFRLHYIEMIAHKNAFFYNFC